MRYYILILSTVIGLTTAAALTSSVSAAQFTPFTEVCEENAESERENRANIEDPSVCDNVNTQDPITGAEKEGLLIKAANLISIATGVAAVIFIILGGLQYILAGGDSNRINTAKDTILFALVGLVLASIAQVIVKFAINRL